MATQLWHFLTLMVGFAVTASASPLQLVVDESTASVVREKTPVLRYRYAGVPYKPYVDLLSTPGGINVLRDAPEDHLHHHGLMFAVKLNGVNFWEEQQAPGVQAHAGFTCAEAGERAAFTEAVAWRASAGEELASEARSLTLHATTEYTLLTWSSRMRPSRADLPVELTGSHYHGLGMRFAETMDEGSRFLYSVDAPGEVVRGTELLTPGPWCAVQGEVEGKPVTVAMFDAPGNVRPATWFTMFEPFAYLSATVRSHEAPVAVDTLTLSYGVAVWDGHAAREAIVAAYEQWLTLSSGCSAAQH